jgi:hypothetical protein
MSDPQSSSPFLYQARRLMAIAKEVQSLNANPDDPLPGLERGLQLHTEQVELVSQIQALKPGIPIDRMLQYLRARVEANRWIIIQYTDHTEQTKKAEQVAMTEFEASKLTDQEWDEFWLHIELPGGILE